MDEPFETLLAAAVLAPSGDNTQPWRFAIDLEASRITLYVDENRDPSPMNSGQGMSRMAVGAALENMLRAAESKGWSTELETPAEPALTALKVCSFHSRQAVVDPAIASRVTNRRHYDGRPVPAPDLAELCRQTPQADGIRACWIHDRQRLNVLANLIGRADGLMLSEPSMRAAFLANVRFDLPRDARADEGLPVRSLELPTTDRLALRMMPRIPDWLLRVGGAKGKFAACARKLVQSASGLCLIVANDDAPQTDLMAGRVLQQAWLAMTALGLAVQPMMSMAILENVLRHGTPELLARLGREEASALLDELRGAVPEIGSDRLAFIMRFGHAQAPTARTGRLPLSANVRVNAIAAGANAL